jgi:hypothetical protein
MLICLVAKEMVDHQTTILQRKPRSKNLLEMAKGHHGSLHLPLSVQIKQATLPRNSWDGDLMMLQLGMETEGAVKLSPANLFSDSHEWIDPQNTFIELHF